VKGAGLGIDLQAGLIIRMEGTLDHAVPVRLKGVVLQNRMYG